MTQTAVDWSLVRYSAIEGTHYFYDAAYPTTIQFLLNGQWEPWDVSWVKRRAQDPDVKRIAEDAEARLTSDAASGYEPWPQSPLPSVNSDLSTLPSLPNSPLSPTSIPPTSPQSSGHPSSAQPPRSQPYISPYAPQQAPAPPTTGQAPEQLPAHQPVESGPAPPSGAQNAYHGYFSPATHHPDTPASPWPFAPNTDTKIVLSLDGDGIRGLSTVLVVESLINAICSKLGRRVDPHQVFDLIGGVSTTGLLGIMIGRMRMRVHRAREAYCAIVKTIFLDKWHFHASLDPHMTLTPHDKHALENCIKDLVMKETGNLDEQFFDTREDSTNVFVIATKVDIGYNQPAIIRSYPTRRMAGPEVDVNLTTWQVIHATVQAPRHMSPSDGGRNRAVIEPGLVDYGTTKNNPIRDLYYECKKLYSYTNDTMVVVSIGTGTGLDREKELEGMANSVEDRTAEARVIGEKFELDNRNLIDQGWMKYFRFNVPDMGDVPLDEATALDRIMEKTSAYLAQPDVGQRFYACVDAITGVLLGDQASWPQLERWAGDK